MIVLHHEMKRARLAVVAAAAAAAVLTKTTPVSAATVSLDVAGWNVRSFGRSKMNNPPIASVIADVICKHCGPTPVSMRATP